MSHAREQQRRPPAGSLAGRILAATIGEDVAGLDEKVMVVIPSLDPHSQVGPCRWQSRDETSLPARGDACLVAFDEQQQPWVVTWWPF